MIPVPLHEIAVALEGDLRSAGAAVSVTGVSTDTRRIQSGDLFFALDGASFRGSDFLPEAFRGGATAAVTHNPRDCGGPLIVVEDAGRALMMFARTLRERLTIPVVGITGSNGKTTTKDALGCVLSARFRTVAAEGSYNNRVGLPLTVARVEPDTEVLVLEIGTSAPGEIARLSKTARPTLAVITSIGASHLEGLGSEEGVLREKLDICAGMDEQAVLLLNADDKRLAAAAANLRDGAGPAVETYGLTEEADHRAYDADWSSGGVSFRLSEGGPRIRSRLLGRHNLLNLLAVAVCAAKLGMTEEEIAAAAGAVRPSPMRLEERVVGGRRIIFDCYNANPTSMNAALELLAAMQPDGRCVAVLGDMLELGAESEERHRELGRTCAAADIALVVFVGPESHAAHAACEAAGGASIWAENMTSARALVAEQLRGDDLILLKGSRGMRLETLFAEDGR